MLSHDSRIWDANNNNVPFQNSTHSDSLSAADPRVIIVGIDTSEHLNQERKADTGDLLENSSNDQEWRNTKLEKLCKRENCILCKTGRLPFVMRDAGSMREAVVAAFRILYSMKQTPSSPSTPTTSAIPSFDKWMQLAELSNFLEAHWELFFGNRKKTKYFKNSISVALHRYKTMFESRSDRTGCWRLKEAYLDDLNSANSDGEDWNVNHGCWSDSVGHRSKKQRLKQHESVGTAYSSDRLDFMNASPITLGAFQLEISDLKAHLAHLQTQIELLRQEQHQFLTQQMQRIEELLVKALRHER